MLNIVLYEPEIPHNTGAIARTCALTNTRLHLIEPLGFDISDKMVKRAGLDYWPLVEIITYKDYKEFVEKNPNATVYYSTTKANKFYTDVEFKDEDFIMFGPETRGIPEEIIFNDLEHSIKIPMITKIKRSLNLANSANIVLFEALRQLNFPNLG